MKNLEPTLSCHFDCDGNVYFKAKYNQYGVIGEGKTPSEALTEAETNLEVYLETLNDKEEY